MKVIRLLATCVALLAAHNLSQAQIYQTEDADGNPVFTDMPQETDSDVVELRDINIADAPEPEAEPESAATETVNESDEGAKKPNRTYEDPNAAAYEERLRRLQEQENRDPSKPHEVLDGETRHEVLDAEPRREVLNAEPRREVLDADPPREVLDAQPRHEVP